MRSAPSLVDQVVARLQLVPAVLTRVMPCGDHTVIVSDPPRECAKCGRVAAVWVNRNGSSACSSCAGDRTCRSCNDAGDCFGCLVGMPEHCVGACRECGAPCSTPTDAALAAAVRKNDGEEPTL